MTDEQDDDIFGQPKDYVTDPAQERAWQLFQEFGGHKYDKVVAFVDMLGFSALTEAHRLDPEQLEEMQRPSAVEFLTAALEDSDLLTQRFVRFHVLIEEAVRSARLPADGTSITFSDCAFYAAEFLHSVVSYAVHVMHLALEQRIPVRIGIGCGEFYVLRIKADFSMINQDHVVQFLGSGVSRAHAAEQCGLKGTRIFLHPSVHMLYTEDCYRRDHLGPVDSKYERRLQLPESELQNRSGVTHEINFLGREERDQTYWQGLQELRSSSDASQGAHYDASDAALNRMRSALGRKPFSPTP
jgi:hypothetical protein